MSQELGNLNLPELVSRLRDLHTARTPLGWPTESAVTKSSVERRIIELITRQSASEGHDDPAERIHCEIEVQVRAATRPSVKSEEIDLRVGGLFVVTDSAFTVSEPVEIEIDLDHYKLRARGNVAWTAQGSEGQRAGICISFQAVVGESAERRLERLILELLRNRVER